MPYRWGEPREKYDPEADVGLPRPFLLGEQVDKPYVTHSLQRPQDPERIIKQHPFTSAPYVPPKFIVLPHTLDRYRHDKDPGTKVVVLTKETIKALSHYWVSYGRYGGYVNRILGKDTRAGVYIQSTNVAGNAYFRRASAAGQLGVGALFPTGTLTMKKQHNLATYALYLWKHDRALYAKFKDQFNAWKASVKDSSRKAYDDWYANSRNAWEQWAAQVRKQMTPTLRWVQPR